MDIIELARELGKQIQKEESFIKLNMTQKEVDDDDDLQEKIADFNMKRYELTQEISKPEKDEEKIDALDKEVREIYDVVINDPKMVAYNAAQDEFSDIMDYVDHIIQLSAQGQDPDTIEKPCHDEGCTGNCSSCGGCH